MGGVPAEIIGDRTADQPYDGWNPSDHPEFREFLDHVAEILAHECQRQCKNPPLWHLNFPPLISQGRKSYGT